MPFLVRVATGLPLEAATYWIVAARRPAGFQPNTLANDLRGLSYLYLWGDLRGIDIADRLRTGRFFTLGEINDLDTLCGRYLEDVLTESPQYKSNVIALARGKSARSRRANLLEKRNRLTSIYSFLEYTSADTLSRLSDRSDRWRHYNSVRDECLRWIKSRYQAISKLRRDDLGGREGLDFEVVTRLRDVIEPDHPENPFEPRVRLRNYLIVRLLLDLGIRRGELLSLRVDDCNLSADKGTISIHRRPDDPDDPRVEQPYSKTAARLLPLNKQLVDLLYEWLAHHRPKIAGARKHAFLLVSSTDGRPLSLSSITKIMIALRRRVPGLSDDLSAHALRHTWNDTFSDAMDRQKIAPDQEAKWRSRLMGWRSEETALHYLKRTIRRRSNEVLMEIQEGLDIRPKPNKGKDNKK